MAVISVNVPVYKLTDAQLGTTGAALASQRGNVSEFYTIYQNIANQIMNVFNE